MSFRTFLPSLGLLCLFCSSTQAQTLDDTLLTVTVNWFPISFTDPGYPEVGVSVDFPGLEHSVTSVGLPQGYVGIPEGVVSYFFGSTLSTVEVRYIPAPMICSPPQTDPPSCSFLQGLYANTGPITAFGTYPISGTGYVGASLLPGFPVNGEIIVAATPEPVSGSLMAIGLAMLALRQRLGRNHAR